MKRLFLPIAVLLLLLSSVFSVPFAQDMEAPEGTWLGTWPYTLPPDHHLNAYASGGPNQNLGNQFRGMVELTPAFYMWASNEYVGILAETWGFVDDNTAYEIKFREDALWSNGSQFDADDVVTTYELGRLAGWTQFNFIDVVEKVDDFTVRFHFIDGEPSLVAERLLLKDYIVADDTYGEFAVRAMELFATEADSESEEWQALLVELQEFRPEELIATGPYTYSLDNVGDAFLTLSWQPNSIYSDTVNFGELKLWAGETETTTPLVLSGEIAHATNVYPPSTIDTFVENGLEIVTVPRGYGPAMLFNLAREPWNIREVRQAVALVIERDQNAFLTNGFGASGTQFMSGILDSMTPSLLSQETIDQLDPWTFDTARAEELLESVGYSRDGDGIWADADGNTLSAEWVFPQDFVDFAGATQDAVAQMNAFGFDITLRALPWQEVPPIIREGSFDLSVWSWGAGNVLASRHFRNPVQRWVTELSDEQPGLAISLTELELADGTVVNLDEMINNVNNGLDTEAHRVAADEVALILNSEMLFIPLNEMLSAEPFNTDVIAGLPAADDPILRNPAGSDHFVIWMLLNGQLSPAG
ncbi:MAG: ABC transporter substrate-binding protein [Chloroflexota bacterium]